jgi:peptide/nickel transport system permease protein
MDVLSAIPAMLLAIAVVSFIGIGAQNAMLAIAISAIPAFVRLLRGAIQTVMNSKYIEAARALGAGHFRIIFKHVLHNILAPVTVHMTTGIADAILLFSSLGYLSLAVQPPYPEWGNMVVDAMGSYFSGWFTLVFPCIAIALVILSLNMIGDGLRDALDPLMNRPKGDAHE